MNGFPSPKLKDKADIKIFILYLMENLVTPLRFSELNDIAVADGVVGCIEFAECFAELLDTGNIRQLPPSGQDGDGDAGAKDADTPDVTMPTAADASEDTDASDASPAAVFAASQSGRYFEITPRGRHAAATLQSKLLHYIRDRSLKSALRRLQFSREGSGISTEQRKREDGRYDVTCIARDGSGSETLRVSIIADSEQRAERIRDTFNERPEHIYRAIFALLSGEANFLFEL